MEQIFSQIKYGRESLSLNYQIKRLESSKTKLFKAFHMLKFDLPARGSASLLNTEVMSFLSCLVSSDKKTWLVSASD
jgi:hypothetical protein